MRYHLFSLRMFDGTSYGTHLYICSLRMYIFSFIVPVYSFDFSYRTGPKVDEKSLYAHIPGEVSLLHRKCDTFLFIFGYKCGRLKLRPVWLMAIDCLYKHVSPDHSWRVLSLTNLYITTFIQLFRFYQHRAHTIIFSGHLAEEE